MMMEDNHRQDDLIEKLSSRMMNWAVADGQVTLSEESKSSYSCFSYFAID